jgi:quinolinate synthase
VSLIASAGLISADIMRRRETGWHRRLLAGTLVLFMEPAPGRTLPMPVIMLWGCWLAPALQPGVLAFVIGHRDRSVRRQSRRCSSWRFRAVSLRGSRSARSGSSGPARPSACDLHFVLGCGRASSYLTRKNPRDEKAAMTVQTANLTGLDLRAEIDRLRKERKAVILAHYYQKPEIQDLADFVGDSLELSRRAAATDAEVIAFCGVRFMADTAKILSPEKIVVLPDMDAGCSLEDSCPPEKFKAFRAAHPDHIALTYINCSTEVKALSDVIVTSSSAETILSQIPPRQKIIFGPDRHLGGYLNRKFGREMLLWPGVCIVHEAFSETELLKLKAQHPKAPVAAHPECPPHIIDHADYVGSTSGILQYAKAMPGDTLIVATEPHIIHQMEKALPEKTFIGAPGADGNCNCNICPYMALNTLEKLYLALRDLQPRIEIEESLRVAAKKSLDAMLGMAGGTIGKGDLGVRR